MISERLSLVFATILKTLDFEDKEQDNRSMNTIYLCNYYIDSMRYTASLCRQTDDPIDIKVDPQTILKLTDLQLFPKVDVKGFDEVFLTLNILLISPPYPFINSLVDQTKFITEVLLKKTDE